MKDEITRGRNRLDETFDTNGFMGESTQGTCFSSLVLETTVEAFQRFRLVMSKSSVYQQRGVFFVFCRYQTVQQRSERDY